MTSADLAFLKTSVALLADFSDAQREVISNASRVETFQPGESIVHAGDEVHFLGVILEGPILASVPTADGGRQVLGQLGADETFEHLDPCVIGPRVR